MIYSITNMSTAVNTAKEMENTAKSVQSVPEENSLVNSAAKVDVYEKESGNTQEDTGVTYKPNAELVDQLKAELDQVKSRFTGMVKEMLEKQGLKIAEGEGIWKTLAKGEFTVDEQTREEAQQAISTDGYWGVERTSTRIVDFAKALVGGNPARVEEMREAFIKGYEAAAEIWGGALPDITKQTYDASMKLFDEWAAEGKNETENVSEAESAEA